MAYGISGGHIEGFREGWAIMPFVGGHCKPHYWRRIDLTLVFTSLCGMETDQERFHPGVRRQFAPGVFMIDRCKRCSVKHAKQQ